MKIKILLISLLLFSCSPEKRLSRLLHNNPNLIKTDTVFKHDTVTVFGVYHDTIMRNTITKDTVIIKDKQLTIKYFNTGEKVYVSGKCDTVTIIKEVPVQVNTVTAQPYISIFDKFKWWIVVIVLILILCWRFER